MLEAEPPTDSEMCRLRALQESCRDGVEGYAVASAWLAALFARTERCITARSRLTSAVGEMGHTLRGQLHTAGRRLLDGALPALLGLIAELNGLMRKIEKEVGLQVT